jgi:hypothetical protein
LKSKETGYPGHAHGLVIILAKFRLLEGCVAYVPPRQHQRNVPFDFYQKCE